MTGQQRRVATNGIELDVIDAGEPGNPVVVLVHGFPESSHSWRHQIKPLVDAGYRVLVPDQRGYAHSTAPTDVDAYRVDHLAADLLGLLDDVGADDAVFVGHDWGSMVVWDLSRLHPDRVRGVVNVSVPYTPWPAPPTDLFKMVSGDRFFYILYFQQVGPPEAELEANVTDTMRKTLWGASAAMFGPAPDPADIPPMEGTGFLDMMAGREIPDGLPAWLTQDGPRRLRRAVRDQRVLRTGELVPQPRRRLPARQGPPGAGDADRDVFDQFGAHVVGDRPAGERAGVQVDHRGQVQVRAVRDAAGR